MIVPQPFITVFVICVNGKASFKRIGREVLNAYVSSSFACDLAVTVDGTPIYQILVGRVQSPPFRIEAIEGNVYGIETGLVDEEVVADGFWVMLPPLNPGEHELRFKGSLCRDEDSGKVPFFSTDVIYHLTIN